MRNRKNLEISCEVGAKPLAEQVKDSTNISWSRYGRWETCFKAIMVLEANGLLTVSQRLGAEARLEDKVKAFLKDKK